MKDNRWTKRCTKWQPSREKEIKTTTMQKMARRHSKEGGNHLGQKSNRQNAMEDIDGALHPALDGQSLGKARQGKTRQGKARQGKTMQGNAMQDKARLGNARQG